MAVDHAHDVFVDSDGNMTDKGRGALLEMGEVPPHYHVVRFINGCLNDYDSGPIETLDEAVNSLEYQIKLDRDNELTSVAAGENRYIVKGVYILKVETCREDINVCQEAALWD